MRRSCRVIFLLFLTVGASLPAPADDTTLPLRKVTVLGTNIIHVVPDEMLWCVSLSINDAILAKAKGRHDQSLADALKFIKSFGAAIKDLQTGGITINKQTYFQDKEDRSRPFSCTTQITFTLIDFEKYGPLVDGLAKLDGIEVSSVDYATSKEASLRREALKQALLDAHDKASDLAVTAGCYIDKPLEILEDSSSNASQPLAEMDPGPEAISTPAAVPAQISISASVTVTYDLYYK
jgi:uncharacterized protein YggE